MCRRRVMTITAIAPADHRAPDPEPAPPDLERPERVVLEEFVVGDHVVQACADDAPDHDPERRCRRCRRAGSRAAASGARRSTTATSTPTARITPYMWKGPRLPFDGLGIEPSSGCIGGHRRGTIAARSFKVCGSRCRYDRYAPRPPAAVHDHRRYRDRSRRHLAGRHRGPEAAAAEVPDDHAPRPRAPDHDHDDAAPDHDHNHPTARRWDLGPERSARQLPGVPGRQRVEPRRLEPARRRRTRRTTSPPSPPPAATRSCTPTSAAAGRTGSRTSPCPARSRRCRSTSWPTATRATPVRTRSRSPRRSRAAATATCSPSTVTTASSTSCSARPREPAGGRLSSGAVFDLTSNALRPEGWTSADAAGLPIFPGLVRYDEVASGHIDHALRFTVSSTQTGVPPPGDALRVVEHRRQPAADGPAAAAEGELRRVALHRRGARRARTR